MEPLSSPVGRILVGDACSESVVPDELWRSILFKYFTRMEVKEYVLLLFSFALCSVHLGPVLWRNILQINHSSFTLPLSLSAFRFRVLKLCNLQLLTKCRLRLVCKLMRRVALAVLGTKWKFRKTTTAADVHKQVAGIGRVFPDVTRLNFFENLEITDAALDWGANPCPFPNLTRLDLSRCRYFTSKGNEDGEELAIDALSGMQSLSSLTNLVTLKVFGKEVSNSSVCPSN